MADYCDLGLHLEPAQNTVEAGLYQVWERLATGRLRVFSHLHAWLQEVRLYRRDERGRVIKENDHLMDCTRYLIMSGKDFAMPVPVERPAPSQVAYVDSASFAQGWMG